MLLLHQTRDAGQLKKYLQVTKACIYAYNTAVVNRSSGSGSSTSPGIISTQQPPKQAPEPDEQLCIRVHSYTELKLALQSTACDSEIPT